MDPVRTLFDAFIASVRRGHLEIDEAVPAHRAVLEADGDTRAAIVITAVQILARSSGWLAWLKRELDYREGTAVNALVSRLLRSSLPFDEHQLITLVTTRSPWLSEAVRMRAVERFVADCGLTPALQDSLQRMHARLGRLAKDGAATAETRAALSRLGALLPDHSTNAPSALAIDLDAWGNDVVAWFEALETSRRERWSALFRHARQATGKSKPTQQWSRTAAELVDAITRAEFTSHVELWFESAKLGHTHQPDWGDKVEVGLSINNQELLKGLVWATASVADPQLAHTVGRLGERCFRKIPQLGPASTKVGNACLHALAAMPDAVGVPHLSRLTEKVRYASGKRTLERALDEAAARTRQTREDIEELSVPTGQLDANGVRRVVVGDYTAELAITDGARVELRWFRPDGRPQSSLPKAVKDTHAEAVRTLKKDHKQLADLLEGQTARLQRLWMTDRRLPLTELRRRYLDHPVVGQIARRLIWRCDDVDVIWRDGQLTTLGGARVDLSDETPARLWHVLDSEDVEQLLVWRDFVDAREVRQPFKQVWREVYRPAAPGATFDDRFAGHIIRQRPLLTLCQHKGWHYTIQGHWDSANYPTLRLPRWNLVATFEATPLAHRHDDAIFSYLVAGRLSFSRPDSEQLIRPPLPIDEIPPLVFSEVMRDVDLFIAASTVANEPSFDEAEIDDDWRRWWTGAVFGELAPVAQTRRDVLARLIPRTTLRDRARLEDRWLAVDSASGLHRIHLGTAHVHRDGTDQPVPIETNRNARDIAASVFLPFEGDAILTAILAKAFALAGE